MVSDLHSSWEKHRFQNCLVKKKKKIGRVPLFKCLISLHFQFQQMLPTNTYARMAKGYRKMVIKSILIR